MACCEAGADMGKAKNRRYVVLSAMLTGGSEACAGLEVNCIRCVKGRRRKINALIMELSDIIPCKQISSTAQHSAACRLPCTATHTSEAKGSSAVPHQGRQHACWAPKITSALANCLQARWGTTSNLILQESKPEAICVMFDSVLFSS